MCLNGTFTVGLLHHSVAEQLRTISSHTSDKYNQTDSDGERLWVRVRVDRENRNIPQMLAISQLFYTRFDRVATSPTKFPCNLIWRWADIHFPSVFHRRRLLTTMRSSFSTSFAPYPFILFLMPFPPQRPFSPSFLWNPPFSHPSPLTLKLSSNEYLPSSPRSSPFPPLPFPLLLPSSGSRPLNPAIGV